MKQWWQKEVVYQIYPKSFYDSNHDGIGDVQGIIQKLDYLKELGVTMLWICPIYASPMDDNGYDISDYYAIHPQFGTMEDVEELIQKAKAMGIKIIMDLVVNHTSDEHAWFQEAIKNPDSPYRDFYIFKEGKEGHAPTNWRSIFGGSVWEKVPNEDNMYYFHAFQKKQPDLNWENPKMRQAIYDMINWWLDKGIAGFRVDAINFIKKNQAYPDGIADGTDGLCSCIDYSRNQEGIEVFFQELRKHTFDRHECMSVAEACGVPYRQLAPFIDEKDGCFSMMFDFNYCDFDIGDHEEWFIRKTWTPKEYRDMLFLSQQEVNALGWVASFLENHDQPRSVNKLIPIDEERNYYSKTMLGAMYFFLRGVPFIYQGQEIGMENACRHSIEEFDDCGSINQYHRALEEGFTEKEALHFVNMRSRDNARTPMQWNDATYAGFSDTAPWLALNDNYHMINVEKDRQDVHSIFKFYQAMIQLRQNSEYSDILTYGDFKGMKYQDEILAYQRSYEGHVVEVICNYSNTSQSVKLDGDIQVLLSNDDKIDGGLHLRPYGCVVVSIK